MAIFDNITAWINQNWQYLIIIGLGAYFIYNFFFKEKKPELKPISRSEEERKRFIDRMKLNHTDYSKLYRGKKYLGKMIALRFSNFNKSDNKKEDKKFIEIVYKPLLIDLIFFKIHWFTKEVCILVNTDDVRRESLNNEINISVLVTFDKYLGVYYDRKYANEFSNYIQIDSQFRTDLENISTFYYAKAQEQSVIQPEFAHTILKEEIKLQQEQEKRARATEGSV